MFSSYLYKVIYRILYIFIYNIECAVPLNINVKIYIQTAHFIIKNSFKLLYLLQFEVDFPWTSGGVRKLRHFSLKIETNDRTLNNILKIKINQNTYLKIPQIQRHFMCVCVSQVQATKFKLTTLLNLISIFYRLFRVYSQKDLVSRHSQRER